MKKRLEVAEVINSLNLPARFLTSAVIEAREMKECGYTRQEMVDSLLDKFGGK